MKNYYLAVLILFIGVGAFAQAPYKNLTGNAYTGEQIRQMKAARCPALQSGTRDVYEMYVDYSAANFDDALYYGYTFNSKYDANDEALNYAAVVINNLVGETDYNDPINTYTDWTIFGLTDSFPNDVVVTIDTVYYILIHSNNSGELDTLTMNLVKTLGNGAPSQSSSSILKSVRDSVDFGLSVEPGGTWQDGAAVILGYPMEYTLSPGQKSAFVLNYYNKSELDTVGLLAGCVDSDQDGIADAPSTFETSYMRLPPNIPSVTKNAQIIYVDGSGNPLGAFAFQNWAFFFKVSINTVVGIADNFDNLDLTKIYPNPAVDNSQIFYGLHHASDVRIDLIDLSGKFVKTLYAGNDGEGSYIRNVDLSDVASGAYLVSLQAGNGSPVVSKLIVSK